MGDMRTWSLAVGDPLCLTLAADARLVKTDYANDQIWNVNWQTGAPPALAVETTFGLRARNFRIFPRFSEADNHRMDPGDFPGQPKIYQAFPNYIALNCMPFHELDVYYELWVPSSQTLAGRLTFTNQSTHLRTIRLDMAAQLTPNEGQRMASIELEAASVLSGLTADLSPIVFMTGGSRPGSGSFPSLRQDITLESKQSKSVIWTHAALADPVISFNTARQLAFRNWDAEISRLEMLNAGTLEFFTGNPDWDAAFKWAQKQALSLIMTPGGGLPNLSLVQTRQPDQGYSPRGDGSDYSHLWNGQNPFSVYSISNILLPIAPETVKGLIRNFLAVQSEDGFIDFKPGIAQQRSRKLATPLLATLVWQTYQESRDLEFLKEVYPALVKFVHCWFLPDHDRDQDGIPEWDHPIQSGDEDHPLFAAWHDWSQGIEISCSESPSLMSFLIRELDSLILITKEFNPHDNSNEFEALVDRLKQGLSECWSEEQHIFFERDRDAHHSDPPEYLGERSGPGTIEIHRQFNNPVRLEIKIVTNESTSRHPRLVIRGTSSSGKRRLEEIPEERIKWRSGQGNLTGERIYQAIERVDVDNTGSEDLITVFTAGYQSMTVSQLLPLWTGKLESPMVDDLVNHTIANVDRFWQPCGLPACIDAQIYVGNEYCASCDPLWNAFIIEGLYHSGFVQLAADLYTRLMNAIVLSLKTENCFRHYYHPQTGQGIGEINSLNGIPPVGLFLKLLGVQIHSPTDIEICGENPFPWPVTVKYRGLTILRGREKTSIIFPDGQTIESSNPVRQAISLEKH